MFGFIRKRFVVKIIVFIIPFLVFLIGITRKTSRPPDNTDLTSDLCNSSAKTRENISCMQSRVSQHGSKQPRTQELRGQVLGTRLGSKRLSKKCDIPSRSSSLAHRFPHIIIIGFGKAGTRALYQMIRLHPDVVGPSHELRFFSTDVKYKNGLRSYIRLMPPTTATQRTIEKSPDYIIKPVAAIRLKEAIDRCQRSIDIKFIVVLREPFKRAVSEYLHWKIHLQNLGKTYPNFEKMAIKKSGQVNNFHSQVNTSIYSYHIKNWLKVFDFNTICFVDGDGLVKDPYPVVKKLEKCLKLRDIITPKHFYFDKKKGFYCPVDDKGNPKCLGSAKGRTHPTDISSNVEMKLKNFFEPYNEELYNITGIDFWGTYHS